MSKITFDTIKKVIAKYTTKEVLMPIIKETVETVVFVLVAVILIRFFIGELRWIPSGSMRPVLLEKDRLFVEKISRWYRAPQRGDILVFYPPGGELKYNLWALFTRYTGIACKDIAYIKRVIGLPGETVEIKENEEGEYNVYINGKELNEPYIQSKTEWTKCSEIVDCGPTVVPEGEYFMMGDNRGNSQDSRYWGSMPKDHIIGHSVFVFWPLDRIKRLRTVTTY